VLSTSALSIGTHNIVASYSGDATYGFSSSSLSQTVLGSGVTVVGSALWIVGGTSTNDHVQVNPVGTRNTGSTGVKIDANLNGVHTRTTYTQSFTAIYIYMYGGNDNVQLAPSLAINTTVNGGNGRDNINLGDGNNTVTLGNGNHHVQAGDGNNIVTLGNGNDDVHLGDGANTVTVGNGNDNINVGDGNNIIVEGNGNDNIHAGDGDNLIVAGLGRHNVQAGNGNNILIDGSVTLPSGDSLSQILGDWIAGGTSNINTIQNILSPTGGGVVTYNTQYDNTLHAGNGFDWFWATDTKDHLNVKWTDLLN
jgi:hypothetical protein